MHTYTIELVETSRARIAKIIIFAFLTITAISMIGALVCWLAKWNDPRGFLIVGCISFLVGVNIGGGLLLGQHEVQEDKAIALILGKQQKPIVLREKYGRVMLAIFEQNRVFSQEADWKKCVLICREIPIGEILNQLINLSPREIERKFNKMHESSSEYKIAGTLMYGPTGWFTGYLMDSFKDAILGREKQFRASIEYSLKYKESEKEAKTIKYTTYEGVVKEENIGIFLGRLKHTQEFAEEIDTLMKSLTMAEQKP